MCYCSSGNYDIRDGPPLACLVSKTHSPRLTRSTVLYNISITSTPSRVPIQKSPTPFYRLPPPAYKNMPDKIWYCPMCNFGPLNPYIDAACPNCGWYPNQSSHGHGLGAAGCSGDECSEFEEATQHTSFLGTSQDADSLNHWQLPTPTAPINSQYQPTSINLAAPQGFPTSQDDKSMGFWKN
ncbi:hypothetical protein BDD12DRAFT_394840 [Trichophaea hybrida]|nr:hypothetical protein BDD12DRAFT_394840 [Trichophaea hybrida]